ncbi:MAG: hypothetical protein QGH60_20875 [Phycisphaerae bacterium]|nr:hypothetical protein [Phycisphaerae bacterium]
MRKFALITIAVLIASSAARGEVATSRPASRPSLAGLLTESRKHEAAGRYAQATKSARAAMAVVDDDEMEQVFRIRNDLRRLARRESSARRLDALASALTERPGDQAIRERAIKICIVELDNPARAAVFVNEDTDQVLQTYVPMAAKSIDEVAEAACRELAEWYLDNIKKLSRFGRAVMLGRVAVYYGRFLKLHKTADAERRDAAEKYEQTVRQLSELGENPAKAPL